MAWQLNLFEEGARPAVLIRRVALDGVGERGGERIFALAVDVRLEASRPAGLRRSLLLPVEDGRPVELPPSTTILTLLRCRLELGAFTVVLEPPRAEPTMEPAKGQPGSMPKWDPLSLQRTSHRMDALDKRRPDASTVDLATHDAFERLFLEPAPEPEPPKTGERSLPADPARGGSVGGASRMALRAGLLTLEGGFRPLAQEERPEPGSRIRVTPASPLKGAAFPPFVLELSFSDEDAQELGRIRRAARGFGRVSLQAAPVDAWLVPPFMHFLAGPTALIVLRARKVLERAGIHPGMFVGILALFALATGLGASSLHAGRQRDEATQEAESARKEGERQSAAALAASQREQACRDSLVDVAGSTGNLQDARKQAAERSLELTKAEIAFRRGRGEPDRRSVGSPAEREQRIERLLARLLERSNQLEPLEHPVAAWRLRLQYATLLEADLPSHVLLWQAFPRQPATSDFFVAGNGLDFRGLWGLSSRVAREFWDASSGLYPDSTPSAPNSSREKGVASLQEERASDPRAQDEWSAGALLRGLRQTRAALLKVALLGREPVYPEQLHLWTLALWHAYNHMPDLVPGRSGGVGTCVTMLMEDLSLEAGPAGEQRPVLPDVVDVLEAERFIAGPLHSTALCPWRDERLKDGVDQAVETVVSQWRASEALDNKGK